MLHATEQTSSPALDRIELIPIREIAVTGTNPRTTFPDDYISELAASIAALGIQTPLWVRRKGSAPSDAKYDLIAGECRLRGARKAGVSAVPCIVKDVDEKGALELQIIENLNRLDVQPIEEGRGYQRLLKDHGYSIEDLIAKLHKSKSYIYGRIKLADLPKLGQEALTAGKLVPSIALRVARIPGAELQKKCLQEILQDEYHQTDRAAADLIEQKYSRELKGAPFDRNDATLIPERGACKSCPYRSGNQSDLFPDTIKGRADVCTNPTCYTEKCDAIWKRRSAEVKAAGGDAFEGKAREKIDFRYGGLSVSSPYVELDSQHPKDAKKRSWRALLGAHAPTVSIIRCDDGQIVEVVTKAAAKSAMDKAGIKPAEVKASAEEVKWREESAQRELEHQQDQAVGKIITAAIIDKIERAKTDFNLEKKLLGVIAKSLLKDCFGQETAIAERRGFEFSKDKSPKAVLREWIETDKWVMQDILAFITEVQIVRAWGEGREAFENEVAAIYGMNLSELEKQTRAKLASQPAPAAKASKKKGAKK